jgi:hypothetical protein
MAVRDLLHFIEPVLEGAEDFVCGFRIEAVLISISMKDDVSQSQQCSHLLDERLILDASH